MTPLCSLLHALSRRGLLTCGTHGTPHSTGSFPYLQLATCQLIVIYSYELVPHFLHSQRVTLATSRQDEAVIQSCQCNKSCRQDPVGRLTAF